MSYNGTPDKLNPKNYGWICKNDMLVPKFATKAPIPEDIRSIISLFCTEKNCNNNKCVCRNEGMFCIPECKCKMNCTNTNIAQVEDEELSE